MKIGNRDFDLHNEIYIMGILNVTPDSFSDGNPHFNKEQLLFKAEKMIREGASVIDIGGESTRPGAEAISADEEQERVCSVIEEIKTRFDIPISVDTYHAATAKEGLRLGADLINDVYGLQYPDEGPLSMASVVADAKVPCVLMHRGEDLSYLTKSVEIALRAGIAKDRIILDPGIGFGKSTEQNLRLIAHPEDFELPEYPFLLGASRKSVIGTVLDLPVNERLEGTLCVTSVGVLAGYGMIRVHDVKENLRAAKMAFALRNAKA